MAETKKKKQRKSPGISYNKWCTDENLILVEGLRREGARDIDIAEYIGISYQTFYNWKSEHPEFAEALRAGAEIVDYKVENALLKRCLGFHCIEKKRIIKNGKVIQEEHTQKYIPPDVTACAIWLNNRKPDEWKRNRDNYTITENESGIQINIVKAGDKKSNAKDNKKSETAQNNK